jgi:Ca2+-binding EF-hand superfamily protein
VNNYIIPNYISEIQLSISCSHIRTVSSSLFAFFIDKLTMELEYSVTETVKSQHGHVLEIHYQIEEVTVESVSRGITTKKERRSRTYDANITRQQYDRLAKQLRDALSFDNFVNVIRPFIMGHYSKSELERAFAILDKDNSGNIHVDEICVFLPIINESATNEALKSHIRKVDEDFDGQLNYNEFRSMILRGIGRDIICNHI